MNKRTGSTSAGGKDFGRFRRALSRIVGRRVTYDELTGKLDLLPARRFDFEARISAARSEGTERIARIAVGESVCSLLVGGVVAHDLFPAASG